MSTALVEEHLCLEEVCEAGASQNANKVLLSPSRAKLVA